MLTDRFVRNAKPGTYADEGGLYLRVLAASKSFVWRRRVDGKDKWDTIGHYPAMGLAEAREALAKRKSGHLSITLQAAFDDYYEHLKGEYVDPVQTERMFEKDILAGSRDTALEDITKAEWVQKIKAVVKRGSPVMSNRLLTQTKRFLGYCKDQGWIDTNPLDDVRRANIGGKETAKDRNLDLDEIASFWDVLLSTRNRMTDGTRWALAGCLLVGLRATEVLTIDDTGRTFTKMQRWHQVPMTRLVKLWLGKRPAALPKDHRVLSHALRRLGKDFTPHDLRRSFASRLADVGVPPHVIEKMLDHTMMGVMAVYNRAEYLPERFAAQKTWDRELLKKIRGRSPGKVTEKS